MKFRKIVRYLMSVNKIGKKYKRSSETYNMCPLNWVDEMEVMGDLYTNMELLNLN